MGTHTYTGKCPRCFNENLLISEETREPIFSCECLDCGFVRFTTDDRMSLEELNEIRRENDLDILKELPEWKQGVD